MCLNLPIDASDPVEARARRIQLQLGGALAVFSAPSAARQVKSFARMGRSAAPAQPLDLRDVDRQMYADAVTPRVVVEQPGGDVATKVERRAALQRMSEALRYRALGWNHEQGKFSVIENMAISRAESAYRKRFLPSNTEGVDVIDPSGWGNVSLKGPFLNKNLKPLTVEQQMKAVGSVQKHVRQNTAVDTHIIDILGLTDDALEAMQKSLVDESVRIIYVGGD